MVHSSSNASTGSSSATTAAADDGQQQYTRGVNHPDDIVIAGMSIRCSQSDNVEEFAQNLFDGVNMVHENLQRCDEDHFGVPKQHGFIKDIRKFDATFFNVHPKQAEGMDPQLRILHEVAYESIIDGGVDPAELKNSNTGVFIGTSNSDAREAWTSADVSEIDGYSLIGTHRAFLANRLSFTFDLRGPSFGVDAACATSGVAINQGYLHIKHGVCDAALVGGVSLVYQPKVSYQILKLGLLCKDGMCKVFDEAADGYVRAEAIVCLLLQRRKNAKRIYATLVHSKINNDGFKEQGITFPCTESQGQLVAEVYAEAGVDPEDVEYVEAHGTGTKIGDPQETNGIALGFAGTRKKPLPIGAVKSNMGHSEHASGAVSVVKILIAMRTGVMPPNLHYKTPNPLIPALVDGRLKVVTEAMKWNSTLAGVNCFGFGGQNSHLILRGNPNVRNESVSDLRLVVYMGRTEEAARTAMDFANRHADDPYVAYLLMQSAFAKPASMPFRGYTILNAGGTQSPIVGVDRVAVEQKPVWWVFSGQGTQWATMGRDMLRLAEFASVIRQCHAVLAPFGLDLTAILTTGAEEDFNDPIVSVVGITAIQIALVELLRLMEISPQGLVGHSAGEIGCAYADGGFNVEEAMLAAYWRGRAVKEAALLPGAMAAVGLSWEKAGQLCARYADVTPACDNADDNVTVSGSAAEISRLVADMKPQNIFAKEVNSYGVAFHSPAMQKAAPIYLQALKKVLPNPKVRTARWVSTAVDEDQWSSNLAKYASAEYFTQNLSSTVKFRAGLKKVPANAIVIEVAPHGLLQGLIRKVVAERGASIGLMKKGAPDNAIHFLESIGKLYTLGLNPRVSNIFPKPTLPAPRDTPFLGSVVRWDHSASWRIPHFTDFIHKGGKSSQHASTLDLSDPLNEYFLDNLVDGQAHFSVGGFLALVAKAYAVDSGNTVEKAPRLLFSDVQFLAPVPLDKAKAAVHFGVSVARKTGYFEVGLEGGDIVATGFVSAITTNGQPIGYTKLAADKPAADSVVDAEATYEEFEIRGSRYGPQARLLKATSVDGTFGKIQSTSYETAIDGLLQLAALHNPQRAVATPTRIRSVRVDMPVAAEQARTPGGFPARIVPELQLALTGGLEIEGITWAVKSASLTPTTSDDSDSLRQVVFVPFDGSSQQQKLLSREQALGALVELALENVTTKDIRLVELVKGSGASSAAKTAGSCRLPPQAKLHLNSFLLKADQDVEIEQGSATILLLQDYFSSDAGHLEKELLSVSSLIKDDGLLLITQRPAVSSSNLTAQLRSALPRNAFHLLAEAIDSQTNHLVLARKVTDTEAGASKRAPAVVALKGNATDAVGQSQLRQAAAEASAAADSSARVWITAPRHGLDWLDTVLQLNLEYPDAGLRLIVDDSADSAKPLPTFNAVDPVYKTTVARDLVANVYRNGQWGAFRSVAVDSSPTASGQPPNAGRTTNGQTAANNGEPYARAAHALLDLARATPGQSLLVNTPDATADAAPLTALLAVADRIGLDVHVVGPQAAQLKPASTKVTVHTDGDLSSVVVAQAIMAATNGQGVDIVYNLASSSVLRESLRVLATSGTASYIEANAAAKSLPDTDAASLSWAVAKKVTLHLLSTATPSTSTTVAAFLAANRLPTFQPAPAGELSPSASATVLFDPSKLYLVAAGANDTVGVNLAYWLASRGATTIVLHLTGEKASPAVSAKIRLFDALNTSLQVYLSPPAGLEESVIKLMRRDGKADALGGVFVVDSAVYARGDANGEESSQKKSDNKRNRYSLDVLAKLISGGGADKFVALTSGLAAAADVQALVEARNAADQSAVLLDVSTLVSSPEAASALQAAQPEQQFVSLQRAFATLESALRSAGGRGGVFSVLPEGKAVQQDSLSLADDETGPQDKSYLPQAVAKIMGIKDFASLDMFLSLGDYGIDSLMAMELGRILERDFNLSLTLQEIRSLCIRDICLMSGATNAVEAAKFSDVRSEFEKPILLDTVPKHYNLGELVPKQTLVLLRQVQNVPDTLFIVHPMEGCVSPVLETLSNHLQVTTYGLNCTSHVDTSSMKSLAASYIQEIKKVQPTGPYNLGGYSFGAGVAFEMALQLQAQGGKDQVRSLVLLDGSHSFVASFTKSMKSGYTVNPNMPPEEMEQRKQSAFETQILTLFVTQLVKTKRKQLTDALSAAPTYEARVEVATQELLRCADLQGLGAAALRQAIVAFAQRLRIADVYKPTAQYTGPVTLIKCSEKMMRNLGEYYELDKVCSRKELIRTETVPGNHEGFVLGESARLTAGYVNDAVFGAGRA